MGARSHPHKQGTERKKCLSEYWGQWGRVGAPWSLTPGTVLSVVTVLHVLGPRIEDVGTATLLDHALLEAGVNTHLEGRRVERRGGSGLNSAVLCTEPPSSFHHPPVSLSLSHIHNPSSFAGPARAGLGVAATESGWASPAVCTLKGKGSRQEHHCHSWCSRHNRPQVCPGFPMNPHTPRDQRTEQVPLGSLPSLSSRLYLTPASPSYWPHPLNTCFQPPPCPPTAHFKATRPRASPETLSMP